ncbi:hypothetical protein K1T71_006531 [Dendrolimus kikuchii]|uniref:Uncharacterized protein n=1 Tax=Dendrolimus kikuchii TaxID=765133 RepID=A0ACC1D254_9NEOP|nr:hypothetical protein K1T71_006531 [Dendrolimus kikuchii]
MKWSRGQLMINLLENKRSKSNTPESYDELDLNLNMSRANEPIDINDKLNFSTENLIAKPDSHLPPNASLVAEEMSFINQVIDFSDPGDICDVTPSVENLYRNLSNIPSDFDSCTSCSNVQTVTAIVHNVQEREPQPLLAPISELIVSKPNNFCQDEIESITPMPSPSVSFSSTCPQTEREIDTFSHIDSDYTDTPLRSPASTKRKSQKNKDTGRLRERFQNKWLDNKRKYNLNRGLEYMSRTGKIHEKKEMKAACKCPRKCSEKIKETARYQTFKNFWDLGDHTRQWDFITKYVSKLEKKRVVTENSQRKCTLRYSIPVSEGSSNIEIVYICKTMFLNTLSISYNFVKTALDKLDQGFGVVAEDRRGKHTNHPVKIPQTAKESSHYTRKETSKIYLDGSLIFFRMFNFYKEWCDKEEIPQNCRVETLRQYRDIVNKNFNLPFHIQKKDKFCHAFENLQNPTDEQKSKHNWQLAEKDKARQNISTFYYKRKLHFHNFTPFDMADLQGYCYCWDEQTAKKGANEIASCVYDFICMKVKEGVKSFIFWSDNLDITHRFLVVGHTQNEGDSIDSVIERKTRNVLIYTPDQWTLAFKMATDNAKPYIVKEITQSHVFDFKPCLAFFDNWKKNPPGNLSSKDLFLINYKNAFEESAYKTIQCLRSNTRTSVQNLTKKFDGLNVAYSSLLPIDKNKFKDYKIFANPT